MNSRYYLINSKNEKKELCNLRIDKEHPENFYAIEYDTVRYKNDADFELNQQGFKFVPFDITFDYKFTDYDIQIDFTNFIDADEEMLLEKEVVGEGQSYFRRVIFKSTYQTPVSQVELYEGNLVFTALSQWFQDEVVRIVTSADTSSAYPLTYPFTYGALGTGETILFNDFNTEVPLLIEFVGESTNPSYTLQNPFGTIIYSGKINYSPSAGEKIVIDSNRFTVELRNATDNTFISNLYQDQDFTQSTWCYLDSKGEYKFTITHEGIEDIQCDVKYRKIRPII